ncbi:MAG: hypothetical protein ACREOF_04540 [Gemmatimonadales bacterium]
MRSSWSSLLAAAGMAWASPATGQRVTELGVHTLIATSAPVLTVGGVYGALRPSARVRLAVTAGAGVADGDPAARGELLGHFLLDPTGRRGAGVYAGGGIAGVVGPVDEGYLVLLVGVEGRPGAGAGWSLEVGLGGGMRIAAGYRWRRHPGPRLSGRTRRRNRPGTTSQGGCQRSTC